MNSHRQYSGQLSHTEEYKAKAAPSGFHGSVHGIMHFLRRVGVLKSLP